MRCYGIEDSYLHGVLLVDARASADQVSSACSTLCRRAAEPFRVVSTQWRSIRRNASLAQPATSKAAEA